MMYTGINGQETRPETITGMLDIKAAILDRLNWAYW